ncbi:hypothetical protein [Actinophytocola gossypii]|uniref:Uncharacterized protein n=1 Tax=Actinophytocola gossypii TaxID=2812003 RepID=A0ABT2J233_9PSEU|nr:hypothetical protein [Actinophytocola gossypii]MCT2581918.1 hypothetical protein [Actinophytocola gossypii]
MDVILLIEQLARSPPVEQLRDLDDPDLLEAAYSARRRLITVALNGLTPTRARALPGPVPVPELLSARWPGPTE